MQNLFWKAYFFYSVIRAYYVESLKATLRYYYFKDRQILPKAMAVAFVTLLGLIWLGALLSLKWLVAAVFLLPLLALPHWMLLIKANQGDETSRRNTEWLKAWSQKP